MITRLSLALLRAAAFGGQAKEVLPDPAAAPARAFTVECEMIEVPGKLMATLIPKLSEEETVLAGWARLQGMLTRGEATLTDTLLGTGAEGRTITTESTGELRCAVDYAPPVWPGPLEFGPRPKASNPPVPILLAPTRLETWTTGSFMQLELSRTGDPGTLACDYWVKHTRLQSFEPVVLGCLPSAERIIVNQPRFYTAREQSSTYLQNGRPKLISVQRLPGAAARFQLFVLTAHFQQARTP